MPVKVLYTNHKFPLQLSVVLSSQMIFLIVNLALRWHADSNTGIFWFVYNNSYFIRVASVFLSLWNARHWYVVFVIATFVKQVIRSTTTWQIRYKMKCYLGKELHRAVYVTRHAWLPYNFLHFKRINQPYIGFA